MAPPATSASSMALKEVMPLLPSARPVTLIQYQHRTDFPPNRSPFNPAVVNYMIVVGSRYEYRYSGRARLPECMQCDGQIDRGSVYGEGARHGIVRGRTLS